MPTTFRCYQLKRSKDAQKRCINLMSPKYSVIVAENKGFSSRNYLGLVLVDLGLFCHLLPGLALSRSVPSLLWSADSANRPGYEADYADLFEVYVAANDIDDDKKVNFFLVVIGPDAYKLLKNLCDPDNPNTKTFTRLTQLLQRHYEPAPIVIAERHKFWTASQGESESVSEFVVRLKKLASSCSFGEFLSQALRDRQTSFWIRKCQRHFLTIYYN